ncbi:molecular chaperone HtpG [Rariglobus hedericola]|uniref:Chaperone protein HtpG n=1 Tax=Rariglobus hedericola TaxID=2597822 RepID=A0A556QL76_9BACT|nr:molecular chaperone HtpG [Rariglobus hedericola]TSJ77361.1 molecular chaperone HtpG [Rariglobus hedericola]
MSTATPQKFEFQAEIKQLLDIVIHSLYTEKEIFVRELVSNASDAIEKLRHLQITEKDNIADADRALEVNLTTDDTAKTLTISDAGLGMTRAELIENLGTIAHSGSKAFLKALSEGGQKNSNLIGQFGVGFYSAFMVAKTVKVYSRSWKKDEPAHVWTSDGSGSYEVEEVSDQERGTKIVIELKDDAHEFATEGRVKEILERYSAFVSFPVNLNGKHINTVQALWLRSKSEITDEEYTAFYKFQAHAYDEPRLRLHFSADAPLQINALLFVPKDNTEKFGMARLEPAVSLYCRKVLIDSKPKDLLPEWLRFMKGVVDSEDLPLNISRETMQDRALIEKLNKVITKRFIKFLSEEAKNRTDAYNEFYAEFGIFLKEGAALDYTHKDELVKLLRFESSLTEKGKTTSLADYVTRMGADQKEIYFLLGPSRAAIEAGPYLEGFKARNLEVLFCYESVDEYVMSNVREFDGKKLIAADHADVKLADAPKPPAAEGDLSEDDAKSLAEWLKTTLGDRVEEVKASDRLVDSPALAVNADKFMSPQMRRMMKAMNKDGADAPVKVNLEINPRHAVIKHLAAAKTSSPEKAALIAEQILDNSLISAGLFEDPSKMVARLYKLLETV